MSILSVIRPVGADAAIVSLSNDHNNIGKGDTITTTIAVSHSGSPVTVDAYLVLVRSDQSLIFFEFDNGGLVPHVGSTDPSTFVKLVSNRTLPDGFDTGPIPIFSYTATGSEEPGTYRFIFALASAGTLTALDMKTASVFLSVTPVLPFLGTYNVTTTIPSLGASGSGTATIVDSAPGVLTLSATGSSAGMTSSYSATVTLNPQGGSSWAMQGNVFGTMLQGNGLIDPSGNVSGTIDTKVVGPFIKSITNLSGSIANGEFRATYTTTFTDGANGTEFLTAVHQ